MLTSTSSINSSHIQTLYQHMAKSKKRKPNSDPHAAREAKKYDHPIASREFILETIVNNNGPATLTKIKKTLNISNERDLQSLERRLRAMERDGQLVRNRQGSFLPVGKADLVRGRIIGHPDGFGFLNPDDHNESDIFLSPREMRAALHGDRAVVQVIHTKRDGRKEGHLVEVVERHNQQIVGRYHEEQGMGFVIPDNKRIHQDIFIPNAGKNHAANGKIVVAKIIEFPTRRQQPIGEIIEILGEHLAPGMEIDIAVRVHGIPNEFPDAAIQEAESFSEQSIAEELASREDLRALPFVTIDGEDAKDFDDAVYCEPRADGWKLYVAIADVSFYVQPGNELDKEAQWRATSVYFPGCVIPMLPENLSNGLCSLNPHIPRLSMVCEMCVSSDGEIQSYKFYKAVIESHARLTYTQVAAAIVDKKTKVRNTLNQLCTPLDELYLLYKALLQQRITRGAIDFHSTETKIEFGPDKKIVRIYPYHRNDAHRVIEECMIAANVAAAMFLTKRKFPGLYRIHEGPNPSKLKELRQLLKTLGLSLPGGEKPLPKHYADLIHQVNQREQDRWIETMLLRSLSQAVYSPDNVGHFGLAHPLYAHFTSPIRRYPDLIVHRAISHLIARKKASTFHYTHNDLVLQAEHCSMAERRADDATRDAENTLKCEFMQDKIGKIFTGNVTGITSFGLFVELIDVYVEGLVHISTLADDYYQFDPDTMTLTGEASHKTYGIGDTVKIIVNRVDIDERKIDFILEQKPSKTQRSKKKSKRKKSNRK